MKHFSISFARRDVGVISFVVQKSGKTLSSRNILMQKLMYVMK